LPVNKPGTKKQIDPGKSKSLGVKCTDEQIVIDFMDKRYGNEWFGYAKG